jgi:UDP-glucose 4-epimerase
MPDVYEVVHAKDVGRAIVAACTVERLDHDTYNVGTGVLVTPSDVVDAIGRLVPGFRIEGEPASRPDPFPRHYPFDLSRSRRELGYEPAYGLELGLADLVARIRLEAAEVSGRG